MSLRLVPVAFAQAREFVDDWHRHHRPPQGHKFSLGIADGDELVGVAVVGRPFARMLGDGHTLEVTRVAVANHAPNGCSMLYAAAWRAAKALGYCRLVTYTHGESGDALRAASGRVVAARPSTPGWSRPARPHANRGVDHIARRRWQPSH